MSKNGKGQVSLEEQLKQAQRERDSWRGKYEALRTVSDSAFEQLTRLRKLLAEMENAGPNREWEIRREIHGWLYPPLPFLKESDNG